MRLALALIVLASCADPPPAPAVPPIVPEVAPPAASPDDLARDEPAPLAPLVVGWPGVPDEPSPALRAELAHGLALHHRGDFAGSEAVFRSVSEHAPTYVNARFDLACALVRLGRLEEAHAILVELVTAALPAIGARLDADGDLADLRTAASWSELTALRARAEAAVRASLESGVVVLRLPPLAPADPDAEHRTRSIEVGVWLPAISRFVPLAPAHAIDVDGEAPSFVAAAVDRARGAVLVVEVDGSWSEGDLVVPSVRAVAHRLGDGTELGRLDGRGTTWGEPVEIHALPDGLAVRYVTDLDWDPRPITRGAFEEAARPVIVAARTNVTVRFDAMPPPPGIGLSHLTVTGLGAPVTLSRAHTAHTEGYPERGEWWAEEGGSLFVLTGILSRADGQTGAVSAALSRIERATGAVELVASARGAAQMLRGGDGVLYAQVGDRVHRLGATPEVLPEGLFLVPDDPAFYPYPAR